MDQAGKYLDFSNRAAIHSSIALLLTLVILISLPFSRAINSVGIILFVVNWLAEGDFGAKWQRLRNTKLIWLFAGMYVWLAVTLLYTNNMKSGLGDLEGKLSLLLFPVVLGTVRWPSLKQLSLLLRAFVLTTVAAALVCHVNAVVLLIESGRDWTEFFGGFHTYSELVKPLGINPAYVAMYACFSVACVWWLIWRKHVSTSKWLWLILGVYLAFFVVHLGARMGVLSLGALVVAALFLRQLEAGNFRTFFIGIAALTLVAVTVLFGLERTRMRFEKLFEPDEQTTELGDSPLRHLPERLAVWYCAWEVISEQPLLGTGIGDVHHSLNEKYAKYRFKTGLDKNLNSHNQFIEAWLSMGLPGILLLLAAVFFPAVAAWRRGNAVYLLFLLLFFLSCLTENMLNTQNGVVFYACVNALLAFRGE